jgi:tetratricopeptide (TPR) repeat protein
MRKKILGMFDLASGVGLLVVLLVPNCPAALCQQIPALQQMQAASSAVYQQARQAFSVGDYVACAKLAKQAVAMGGGKEPAMLLALAYAESGDTYNANASFLSALTMDYNFVKCRNNYGVFLIKCGRLDAAKAEFETCLRIESRYPDAYYHLGELAQKEGDLDKAIENFQMAIRLNPNFFEATRDLGLAIYEQVISGKAGEISESLEKLKAAAQLCPDNAMIHLYLGRIYCADGKLDDAEAEFRQALSIDPKFAAAHFELGKLRYLRGDLDRCIQELKLADSIPPTYADSAKQEKVDALKIKELLGEAETFKALYPEAIETYREIASVQKKNQMTLKKIKELEHLAHASVHKASKSPYSAEQLQAQVSRGLAQAENGHLEQAKSTFDQGLKMDSENFACMQNLASMQEATGDLQGALSTYKAAMALMPKYDGVFYNMAYVLEKLGLPAEAGMMYQRYHEVAGSYPYDPKHIVSLQQEDARKRARAEELKKRGY